MQLTLHDCFVSRIPVSYTHQSQRDQLERAQLKSHLANANAIPMRSPSFQRGGGLAATSPMMSPQYHHPQYMHSQHHAHQGLQQHASQRNNMRTYYTGSPGGSSYGSANASPNQYQHQPQYQQAYGQQQQQFQQHQTVGKPPTGGKYPKARHAPCLLCSAKMPPCEHELVLMSAQCYVLASVRPLILSGPTDAIL
jgi:hypothetical protein